MDQPLTDELYLRFRDLLSARCGLYYPDSKRGDLVYGLNVVLRASGLSSLSELEQAIKTPGPAWELLLTHLTIGETYFFRNAPQIQALRQHILPELIARRASMRSLRLWSAGCASGEEPYSLAMLLDELLPDQDGWHITILATDINPQALARAREGLYGEWSFRETGEDQRRRFFQQEGNRWRIDPRIRRAVQFSSLNLVEPTYPSVINGTCALDLILCRNVTIYFEEATTRQIVERFYHALAPGGWLVVGHAEPQAGVYHQYQVCNFPDTIVYRKPLDAPLFGFDPTRGTFSQGEQPLLQPRAARRSGGTRPLSPERVRSQPASSGDTAPLSPERLRPQPTSSGGTAPLSPERVRQQPASPGEPAPPPLSTPPAPTPPILAQHENPAAAVVALAWSSIKARMALGDKTGAGRLARDLVAREPEHVEALTLLGRLSADNGDLEAARQFCERALAASSLATEAHYILAQVYEQQDLLDEALASYRRAVFLDREFVLGTLGMANIWRRMGRHEDARRSYQKVLRQLSGLPTSASIHGAEGMTVGEIVGFVTREMNKK